jgi:predicted metal-dependent hydrolase
MLQCDPNDIEVIECRAENLKFIQNNLKRMKEIIEELINLDKQHEFKDKDVYIIEKFEKINENEKKEKELKDFAEDNLINHIENILEELEI